ncbi:hypothetical protein [Streptomyces roseolus]|uniref:hypothetical protein n=1 Tax=Streptomyces roseolus TaxID=67358 RepID=UPI0036EEF631
MSDEEWERFLRDAEAGAGSAPVEPSARARETERRLRDGAGRPEGWRTYTPAAPRPRSRTGWYVTGFVAAVALLVVALFPQRIAGWFGGDAGRDAAPLAAETGRPQDAPGAEPDGRATLAEPFRGTPAARWADGAAGITVPEAKATGWMDAARVEQALARSRDFLVAAGLDPRVLRGARPTRAIALLNPHQKDVQQYLRTALSTGTPTPDTDPLLLFSRFHPERTRLVGDVVKTRGRLTYREGKRGAVEVTADVTFVYPVTPADGDGEVLRTIARRQIVMSWDDPEKVLTEPGTMTLLSYALDMTNGGCDAPTGYFVPPFGRATADGEGAADASRRVDPYDRSEPVDLSGGTGTAGDGCATATRS